VRTIILTENNICKIQGVAITGSGSAAPVASQATQALSQVVGTSVR